MQQPELLREETLPVAVVNAIIRRWPDEAAEILPQVKHARDHYFFNRWGMYIGIEYDGYIHT
jgi:hypothetical protein